MRQGAISSVKCVKVWTNGGRGCAALFDDFVNARAGTPKSFAKAWAESHSGTMKSSRSTSPGWTARMRLIGRVVGRSSSMVINNFDGVWVIFSPHG